jgi:hypothetical protein
MFIPYIMWKSTVVGNLFVLHEGSVVGWMTKESSINYWQGKVSLSSTKHSDI